MNDKVHFLGFQKNPYKYIAKSKVFVLSSLFEGFPNSLSEAMACGVPIISSDCFSGPREILAPKEFNENNIDYNFDKSRYGILTPVCDGNMYSSIEPLTDEEEKIAELILALLSNPDLHDFYSKKSLERINDFDVNKIIA